MTIPFNFGNIWTDKYMKEINYKDLKFNPFNLIGDEWMLVTAGNKQSGCNTMTASMICLFISFTKSDMHDVAETLSYLFANVLPNPNDVARRSN